MRAEPHVAIAGQNVTTVLALVLRQTLGRTGDTESLLMHRRRRRDRVFTRRVEQVVVVCRRSICALGDQHALGGAAVDHDLRLGKTAEVSRVGVDGRDFPLHGFADRIGFELNIAALAREQPQYRHLVILMGRDVQVRAVGAIGHEPLVYFCRRERDRDSSFSGEGGDQQAEQSIELVHYAPFLHALIQRSYSTGTTPPCCSTSTPEGSRYALR